MKANETNNTNPMQRVSKCESVVFCGAAASGLWALAAAQNDIRHFKAPEGILGSH